VIRNVGKCSIHLVSVSHKKPDGLPLLCAISLKSRPEKYLSQRMCFSGYCHRGVRVTLGCSVDLGATFHVQDFVFIIDVTM
jgi:hypothetical protein